jgi:hypothetical protein
MTGDTRAEIAVEGHSCTDDHKSVVLDGATGAELFARAGNVFAAGDANGDGRPEVRVSDTSETATHAGVVHSLVRGDGVIVATTSSSLDSATPTSTGQVVTYTAGDLDGDGTPEFVEKLTLGSGASAATIRRARSGRTLAVVGPDPHPVAADDTYAFSGSTDGAGDDAYRMPPPADHIDLIEGLTGSTRWTLGLSNLPYQSSQATVWRVADLNGDGRVDLALRHVRRETSYPYRVAYVIQAVNGSTGAALWSYTAYS